MKQPIRIPVFDEEFLFNIRNELTLSKDEPDLKWIDQNWKPEIDGEKVGMLYDSIAEKEVFRLIKFKTCAYCREPMTQLTPIGGKGEVLVCKNCFYWGGRGTRPGGPSYTRGNLGRLSFIDNPEEVKLQLLINHLNDNIDKLYNLTPRQAEKLLPSVLSDYLNCEVKAIGGSRDNGIDAIAIKSDKSKILIQVKWREKKDKSEAVSVVREVGGTLLARQIPNGLIISTRNKFSADAKKESKLISQNEIVSIGKINIELKDFNDLIDMFEISAKTKRDNMKAEDIITHYNDGFDLFGMP